MRPSSRLIVPTLTVLFWSIDAAHASLWPPAQSIFGRQVRSADYSTSTRPSYDNGNNATSPETSSSSTYRSTPSSPQSSYKTKRELFAGTDVRLPEQKERRASSDADATYVKLFDGNNSRPGIEEDLTTRDVSHKPRRPDGRKKKRASSIQTFVARDVHRPKMQHRDGQKKRRTKGTGHHNKKTASSVSHRRKTSSNDGRKNVESHSSKKKKDVRRSAPINLLHIARGIKPQGMKPRVPAVDPPSLPSKVSKSVPAPAPAPAAPAAAPVTPPSTSSPQVPGKDAGDVPKRVSLTLNTPNLNQPDKDVSPANRPVMRA